MFTDLWGLRSNKNNQRWKSGYTRVEYPLKLINKNNYRKIMGYEKRTDI